MQEEEGIRSFLQKVDEMVNTLKGLGKGVNEHEVVQNVLRSLPIRFNTKVFAIEENKHLEKLTMDALWGILIAYEIRIGQQRP